LNKITDLKSPPKVRVQKFNIARGELKEKKLQGISTYLPYNLIHKKLNAQFEESYFL
jgi:hypothetical protein